MKTGFVVCALAVLSSSPLVWAGEACSDAQKLPKKLAEADACGAAEMEPLIACLTGLKGSGEQDADTVKEEIRNIPQDGASSKGIQRESKALCGKLEKIAVEGLAAVRKDESSSSSSKGRGGASAPVSPASAASLAASKKKVQKNLVDPFAGDLRPGPEMRDSVVSSLPDVKPGDRGARVVALQKSINTVLEHHDVPPIEVDGVYGRQTARALTAYEKFVAVTDVVSGALESTKNRVVKFVSDNFGGFSWFRSKDVAQSQGKSGADLLELGDKGEAVAMLKDRLRTVPGIPKVGHTNEFDAGTVAAVKALQTNNKLDPTGIVDTKLWAILFADKPGPAPVAPAPAPIVDKDPARGSKDFKPVALADGKSSVPVVYRAVMNIDSDGAGGAWQNDKWQKGEDGGRTGTVRGKPMTALSTRDSDHDQVYLDPSKIPYIVLPKNEKFEKAHGIKLGDYVAIVRDDGRIAFGIFGDRGPAKGEASIRFAQDLGIDASVNSGGSGGEKLTYVIFPGSGRGFPSSEAQIRAAAEPLYRQSRGI